MQEQGESSDNYDALFKHVGRQEAVVQHDLGGYGSESVMYFTLEPVALDIQGPDIPDVGDFELLPDVDSPQLQHTNLSPPLEQQGGQDVNPSPPLEQTDSSPTDESAPPPKRKRGRPPKQVAPAEPVPKKSKKYNDPNVDDKRVRNTKCAKKNRDLAKERLSSLLEENASLRRENAALQEQKIALLAEKNVSDGIIAHLREHNTKKLILDVSQVGSKVDGGHDDLANIEVTPLDDTSTLDIDETIALQDLNDPELDLEINLA